LGIGSATFEQGETLVESPALHLREMARECRRLAETARNEDVRRELMLVAERFDRLAQVRGQRETRTSPGGAGF